MARFVHPELDDVPLEHALGALADPVRVAIVARLDRCDAISCSAACPGDAVPKSTRSNHFKLLRAAGLVHTTASGREAINRLRRAAFDRRFPGLLDAVLSAHMAASAPK